MLIPVNNERINLQSGGNANAEAMELLQAVSNDISRFCLRNPSTCSTAGDLAQYYGVRIQQRFVSLGQFFDDVSSDASKDQMATGAVLSKK